MTRRNNTCMYMLQNALQISKPNLREEDLFMVMLNYFNSNYPRATWLHKTHQYYVRFNCTDPRSNTFYKNKRCEISDLLIITYSPRRNIVKATFLQAKYSKKEKPTQPFVFAGDAFQYFLLSQRPLVIDNHNPSYPQDVLSNALRDSIGSFGVFYKHNHQIDFSFSVASQIQIQSPSALKNVILRYTNQSSLRMHYGADIDALTVYGVNNFECELLNLEIGSPFNLNQIRDILSFYYPTHPNVQLLCESMNVEMAHDVHMVEHPHILIINADDNQ